MFFVLYIRNVRESQILVLLWNKSFFCISTLFNLLSCSCIRFNNTSTFKVFCLYVSYVNIYVCPNDEIFGKCLLIPKVYKYLQPLLVTTKYIVVTSHTSISILQNLIVLKIPDSKTRNPILWKKSLCRTKKCSAPTPKSGVSKSKILPFWLRKSPVSESKKPPVP